MTDLRKTRIHAAWGFISLALIVAFAGGLGLHFYVAGVLLGLAAINLAAARITPKAPAAANDDVPEFI